MIGELFGPTAEFLIQETCKPHWSQAGAVAFITIRTLDSIPKEVLRLWDRQRCEWLLRCGVMQPGDSNWKSGVERLDSKSRHRFQQHFNRTREAHLDTCHGSCPLQAPEISKILFDSLLHFDRDRYQMGDFVVMPNHVHLLCAFRTAESMKEQCRSWTHFTATKINRQLGQKGNFWQPDPFDHLVRSREQYDYLRDYIRDNPRKAKLNPGSYRYYRRSDG